MSISLDTGNGGIPGGADDVRGLTPQQCLEKLYNERLKAPSEILSFEQFVAFYEEYVHLIDLHGRMVADDYMCEKVVKFLGTEERVKEYEGDMYLMLAVLLSFRKHGANVFMAMDNVKLASEFRLSKMFKGEKNPFSEDHEPFYLDN